MVAEPKKESKLPESCKMAVASSNTAVWQKVQERRDGNAGQDRNVGLMKLLS